ncbi:MAG TPA: type 4a pilus biogenesis protein PilO [Pyrinomonadaceae bacterium]|jgi:type IV pilus assembly protein PilO|nr:type 4a pilus biogenesis protein PilO [Pyrinomonadaceae bacterium]
MKKLVNLAWYWQLVILVGVGSLLWMSVWYMWTGTTRAETEGLQEEVNALQAKNQAAQIATQRINEFRALFASKSEEYDELKVLLPEQREITNILQGLQDSARQSSLIVMRFSPRDDMQQDFVMGKPVEVEVDSNFNNLRAFFDKMAKLQRVVSISDFNLKQIEKQTPQKSLHAQFLLTAYYASPESLNNLSAPPPAQPGAPGAPAAAPGQPAAPNGAPAAVQNTVNSTAPPAGKPVS